MAFLTNVRLSAGLVADEELNTGFVGDAGSSDAKRPRTQAKSSQVAIGSKAVPSKRISEMKLMIPPPQRMSGVFRSVVRLAYIFVIFFLLSLLKLPSPSFLSALWQERLARKRTSVHAPSLPLFIPSTIGCHSLLRFEGEISEKGHPFVQQAGSREEGCEWTADLATMERVASVRVAGVTR